MNIGGNDLHNVLTYGRWIQQCRRKVHWKAELDTVHDKSTYLTKRPRQLDKTDQMKNNLGHSEMKKSDRNLVLVKVLLRSPILIGSNAFDNRTNCAVRGQPGTSTFSFSLYPTLAYFLRDIDPWSPGGSSAKVHDCVGCSFYMRGKLIWITLWTVIKPNATFNSPESIWKYSIMTCSVYNGFFNSTQIEPNNRAI